MTFMARNIVAINSPDIKLILTYFCYTKPIIKNHADNSLNKIIYIYNFMKYLSHYYKTKCHSFIT